MSAPIPPSSPPLTIDIEEIQRLLPYRYPFLLIDRVLAMEGCERIVVRKNVTCNEPFFQGHFPGRPIMPGLLIIEAMAQATALMVLYNSDEGAIPLYLAGVNKAKIMRPVVPGDCLELKVETILMRETMGKVKGTAFVDGEQVATAEITFAKPDLDS
ncbi:MAG: 3-hydroxyacyl-ACP dehydratase FabZ [Thermodesulfobacteriota bacterium]